MRSQLIFEALRKIPNRYFLAKYSSAATRMLHKPNTPTQDTMNDALRLIAGDGPIEAGVAMKLASHVVNADRFDGHLCVSMATTPPPSGRSPASLAS